MIIRLSSIALLLSVDSVFSSVDTLTQTREFENWLQFHSKTYNSENEKLQRLETWLENDRKWNSSFAY